MKSLNIKKVILFFFGVAFVQGQTVLPEMIAAYQKLYRGNSSKAELTLHIKTPSRERNVTLHLESKGKNCLIKVVTPVQDKGTGTLKVAQKIWDYSPKTGKVYPVADSSFLKSWMGSDFTYDDIFMSGNLEENYTIQLLPQDPKEPAVRQMKCTAKLGMSPVWGIMLVAVDAKRMIPVRVRCFDEQRKLLRTINYKNVIPMNGTSIPSVIEIVPATKNGYSSRLIYNSLQSEIPYEENYFTLTKLREPN